MRFDPARLDVDVLAFLRERHLATITTMRGDGSPHVVPVGFTYDADQRMVRVITNGASQKAVNLATGGRAVVCQVDGRRWLALEGDAHVRTDPASVEHAERAYAERYQTPRERPGRVAIEIQVDRILGTV
jgi:PPOX class probable F420-dependent enzyme